MRGNEVLQHREALAEIRGDGRLDDLARGLGHQTTHTRKLPNLLLRSASAGVGDDVDRIDRALFILFLDMRSPRLDRAGQFAARQGLNPRTS